MTEEPGTLRQLVGAYLTEQCTVILDAEPALRGGENVIHVTRVAVRRLRSTLRVFGDLFDVAQAGHLEDELVWWAGLLGVVRDLDILAEGLTSQLAALPPELVLGPVESTISTEIATSRKAAMDVVLEAMDSERYRALVALMQTWPSEMPFTPAKGAVCGLIAAGTAVLVDLAVNFTEAGRSMAGEEPTFWVARHMQGPLGSFALASPLAYALTVFFLS